MKELLKKLFKLEIRLRKKVNSQMKGSFSSVFKGSGIEFADIRSYQYGDDIRTINWTATAKGHDTYVNTYKEEHEQQVIVVLDVSGSQNIGRDIRKIDVSREIAALMALVSARENSQVGLLCFSDSKEKYVKPQKGMHAAYNIISSIYRLQPKSYKTDLNEGLRELNNVLKKKSLVILISDFIDDNYEANLTTLAIKHDLIVIHVSERRESIIPRLGIIPIYDNELQKTIWVNSSSKKFRESVTATFKNNNKNLMALCKKTNADYLNIFCHEDYILKLIELFKNR
ncbi:MAG: DUF58 domain-containing protein [Cytophagales bacterium]